MKWTIPEKIVEKGRTYANDGRVLNVNADTEKVVWYAEVLGSKVYHIVLDGSVKEEDICDCPYWMEHHYCKHTIAVELYLRKKGLNRIIAQNPVMLLPKVKKSVAASEIFLRGFEKPTMVEKQEKKRRPLSILFVLHKIETNKYHPELDVLALSLKIGLFGNKKTYIIKNLSEFFQKFADEKTIVMNQNAEFQLKRGAFDEKTLALLEELFAYYQTTQLFQLSGVANGGKIDKRYLILPTTKGAQWIEKFVEMGCFCAEFGDEVYEELHFMRNYLPLKFSVKAKGHQVVLYVEDEITQVFEHYGWVLKGDLLYFFNARQMEIYLTLSNLRKRVKSEEIVFEQEEISELFTNVLPNLEQIGEVTIDAIVQKQIVYTLLETKIYMKKRKGNIDVRVDFHYEETVFSTDEQFSRHVDNKATVIRKVEEEKAVTDVLTSQYYRKTAIGFEKALPSAEGLFVFFRQELPRLRQLAKVFLGKKLSGLFLEAQKFQPMLEISETGSWLDVRFDVSGIDVQDIDTVLASLLRKEQFVTLSSGEVLSLDSEEFKQTSALLNDLRQNIRPKNGKIQLPLAQSLQVQQSLSESRNVHFTEAFKKMSYDLTHSKEFPLSVPKELNATLRDYQLDGVKWLKMLSYYGFGGILADEMGLGKTLQTITYLLSEKEEKWKGTAVIVTPASLTYNWLAEFEKFAPSLKVAVISGSKDERVESLDDTEHLDVLLTSYASLRQDIEYYNQKEVGYLILDEAQMVKNSSTKTAQALRGIQVNQRFALSGTPIENNIDELWSIFGLILPGFFPSKQKYNTLSKEQIAQMVQPFILRRVKKEVLTSLPQKMETTMYCQLTEEQKTVYLAYLRQMQNDVQGMDKHAFSRNRMSILTGLTRLRQICNDPHLFMEDYEGSSGKLEQVKDILVAAKENNRRVLLFSQFTSMLSIIERELNALGLETFYLRGSTKPKERLEMVDAFNAGEKDVFLISLKAGGTGLNLTGADTVLLYDIWWNPAVEEQAAGRAHRIGQTKNVEVWRMICQGTIEERMNQLQNEKRELFAQVIAGDAKEIGQLTEEDIRMILSIGEE